MTLWQIFFVASRFFADGCRASGVPVSVSFQKKCPPRGSVRVRTPLRGRKGRCSVYPHSSVPPARSDLWYHMLSWCSDVDESSEFHCGVSTVTALRTSDDNWCDVFTCLSNSVTNRLSSMRWELIQLHTHAHRPTFSSQLSIGLLNVMYWM